MTNYSKDPGIGGELDAFARDLQIREVAHRRDAFTSLGLAEEAQAIRMIVESEAARWRKHRPSPNQTHDA